MSDQSKDRKDEARDFKEPLELPEEALAEEPLAEEALAEVLPEELWSEELWPEELWPEGLWPEGAQAEEALAEEALAEESRTEEAQIEETQMEEAQTEEAQTEEAQTEESQTEESQTEESQTEESQTEESQTEPVKSKKKQRIIMIVTIVLAVVAVIATVLVLLHNRWFRKPVLPPGPGQSDSGSVSSAAVSSTDPVPGSTSGVSTGQPLAGGERRSEDFFTILIFGMDQVSGLTDTIMVASYDVTNQKAAVLSIPRDTLINNDYSDNANMSINATYSQNGQGEQGAAALKTEVSRLIGFVPDFYVTINWELVGKMVDAIGGVYYDIPWHMGYDDPTQDLHIHFEAGYQYLNGEAAMNLVRWRQNNDGFYGGGDGSDLVRLDVQHDFLKAILKRTLQPQNIVHIPDLIRLFNENVVSDLAVENMLWFGEQAVLGGLSTDDVEFVTMPVYGTNNIYGRYFGKVCPILDDLLTIVNDSMNPYVEDVTIHQLDALQMSEDGNILSSTTGVLRNPSVGEYTPPEETGGPEESDPLESDPMASDPTESDPMASDPTESDPMASDPTESDPMTSDPTESDPMTSDPAESDPMASDPAESDPMASDPTESDPAASDPAEIGPGPDQTDDPPPETGPAVTGGDGPDDGNWGDTPD